MVTRHLMGLVRGTMVSTNHYIGNREKKWSIKACVSFCVSVYTLFELNIQSFEIPLNTLINAHPFKEKESAKLSSKFTSQLSHNIRTTQKW